MIETIAKVELPVDETLYIRKNRMKPLGEDCGKRISIVTGIHGDELEGQYVAFALQERIQQNIEHLKGTVDVYPGMNPLGIDSITRGIPAFDLDMKEYFVEGEELMARALCHEIAHLDGDLYIDHVEDELLDVEELEDFEDEE